MALLSCVLVVGVLTSSVLAKDYTVGKSYAWSADSSSWYGYGNSPSIGQTVSTYSRLSWTTAAAAAINGELYTTIEHNVDAADNGVPLSAYRVFSDYPNPYYSYEDDGGDGYAEEAEVVFLDRVTPNIEYSVITDYKKETTRALSGTFNTILQRSFWLAGYQTMDYDLLETTSWQSPAARSSLSDEAVVDTETVTEPAPPRHVVRESEVTSDNLTAYFENQFSAFSEAFQMQPRTSVL